MKRIAVLFYITLFFGCVSEPDKTESNAVTNPFFFGNNVSRVQYDGRYMHSDMVEQPFFLNIVHLQNYKNGTLFVLILDKLKVSGSLDQIPSGRENLGYFYVTRDKIYRLAAFEPLSDEKTSEIINSIFNSESNFIQQCQLVCQDKATKDIRDEDGWHEYIEAEGDKRRFRHYNDGGGTTWYERIVWQKGSGLMYYRSGFGSGREEIAFGFNLNDD